MLRPVSVEYSRELVKICIVPVSPGAGRFAPAESVATRPLREANLESPYSRSQIFRYLAADSPKDPLSCLLPNRLVSKLELEGLIGVRTV